MLELLSPLTPRELTASAARNCYSSKFVFPEDMITWVSKYNNTDSLLIDLIKAGHNTVFEHFTFNIRVEGYSRYFIWRVLHSLTPHYSSDQESQRYTEVKEEKFYYPDFLEKEDYEKWKHFYLYTHSVYLELTDKLQEKIGNRKKALEFARYVLPLGQTPHLVWTINFMTALRFIAFAETISEDFEISEEIKKFGQELKTLLLNIKLPNKYLQEDLRKIKEEFEEFKKDLRNIRLYDNQNLGNDIRKIDKKLKILEKKLFINENYSQVYKNLMLKLIEEEKKKIKDIKFFNCSISTEYLKPVPTIIEKSAPKEEVFSCNSLSTDYYPFWQGYLNFVSFTTVGLLSCSADSQNQRHRHTIKYRPLLQSFYNNLKQKYYIPEIIKEDADVLNLYTKTMEKIYSFFEEQSKKYGFNKVLYLLPNAQFVAVIDKDNLFDFTHKAQKRLCFNAQEEIWHWTYEQVKQLKTLFNPAFLNTFPPCQVRKKFNKIPICPEGKRFCGIKVWNIPFEKLKRKV